MARSLGDYLDLGATAAREQWLRVDARDPARPRQPPFEPVETILCFALFFRVDPHRYGGGNIRSAPAEVHRFGEVFRRTPGSVTSKMLNLDGSRPNAGANEVALCVALWGDTERFIRLYRTALEGARSIGIPPARLPDILLLESGGTLHLLGQDEVEPAALGREVEHRMLALGPHGEVSELATARMAERQVRVGQHRFAAAVVENYAHRCGFCGFDPGPLRGEGLIVASHIKPWAQSDNRERLDVRNGVAACLAHDKAFDRALLTVNGGLRIHRSPRLAAVASGGPGGRLYGDRALAERLLLPPGAKVPGAEYLRWHNAAFRGGGWDVGIGG